MSHTRAFLVAVTVLAALTIAAMARQGSYVSNPKDVEFRTPVRVADMIIPAGEYTMTHVMQGEKHIMVFTSKAKGHAAFRVGCNLVSLPEKATRSEQYYNEAPNGDRILVQLIFAGDQVKHVF